MRRLAFLMMALALPIPGFAQDAVIRIEAKRGADESAAAAARWAQQFDNVVTFSLPRGWTAIALGPMTPEQAGQRIGELKQARQIPMDSFVTVPDADIVLMPVGEMAQAETALTEMAQGDAAEPADVVPDRPSEPIAEEEGVETLPAMAEEVTPPPDMPAAGSYIRLQSLRDIAEGEEALTRWRETFPEAGLHAIPGDWFGVTLGPLDTETATAWLGAFKTAGIVPRDAFVSDSSDLGEVLQSGDVPGLPSAGPVEDLPPLDEVQRVLRWAGRYDGAIDGKTGPMTRDAIAAEVAGGRLSPDPGTAMRLLIEQRSTWRAAMGLTPLRDEATGLSVTAPMDRLQFDRTERSLSIYGPKDGSGAALILFSQPGGQQELLDLTGLVTALGWVPQPQRTISSGHALLQGANADHIGRAEGWVRDGRAEGYVLIWPAADTEGQARIAAELSDSLTPFAPAANDGAASGAALPLE